MSFLRLSTRVPARAAVPRAFSIRLQSTAAEYQYILTSTPRPGVGQSAPLPRPPPHGTR